jgi:plastocyanin
MHSATIYGALSPMGALVVSGGGGPTSEPASTGESKAGDIDIAITGSAHAPANVSVRAGAQVRWVKRDGVTSTVTFDDGVDSGRMSGGSTLTRGFPLAATFPYHCSISTAMNGTVTVAP